MSRPCSARGHVMHHNPGRNNAAEDDQMCCKLPSATLHPSVLLQWHRTKTKPTSCLTRRAQRVPVWNHSVNAPLFFFLSRLKFCRFFVSPAADSPSLLSHVPVTVQVLDVNDNPPEIATDEEVIVCESSRPGQVSISGFTLQKWPPASSSASVARTATSLCSARELCVKPTCADRTTRVLRRCGFPQLSGRKV